MKLSTRKYIYGICLALGPIALSYGLITDEQWPLFATLASAVIAPGLALQNLGGEDDKSTGGRHAAD